MGLFDHLKKVVQSISRSVDTTSKRTTQTSALEDKEGNVLNINIDTFSKNKTVNSNLNKKKKMTMFNYGVGGNEVKVDANEAIQEIQGNKSLLVAKLTTEDTVSPEIVTGLKTVEEVFNYYAPTMEVEHETPEGLTVKEEFRFKNLGDFTPKKMVENSPFLKGLKVDEEQYNKIVKQLRVNKVLRKMLEDDAAKSEFAETLRIIAKELEK
ncbi:hypothetical protein [Myroides sp. WP-1]|uniref:hypothetical protein n=1 Tax=Myroides sp. WP-1 TaxID=2759944 RepID=UPI0015FB6D56|nr:hypothetical protein [Myroides sp. WP-1]